MKSQELRRCLAELVHLQERLNDVLPCDDKERHRFVRLASRRTCKAIDALNSALASPPEKVHTLPSGAKYRVSADGTAWSLVF